MGKLSACYSHKSDEWETPLQLFNELDQEFNFDIDLCANEKNHKCNEWFENITKLSDVCYLIGYNIFCNPPYSKVGMFVQICEYLKLLGNNVVMLIPSRTDTRWFHNFIYKKPNVEIRFIKGRVKFLTAGQEKNAAPFPSMLVIFRGIK